MAVVQVPFLVAPAIRRDAPCFVQTSDDLLSQPDPFVALLELFRVELPGGTVHGLERELVAARRRDAVDLLSSFLHHLGAARVE